MATQHKRAKDGPVSPPAGAAPPDTSEGVAWRWALAAALSSGLLLLVALPAYDWFPLAFVALVPLLWLSEHGTRKQVFWASWLSGFVLNYLGYDFLTITLERFGGFPYALALLGAVLLSLYQGLRTALVGLWVRAGRRRGWPLWLVAPVAQLALELVMPFLFTFHMGNSQYLFTHYIQVADLAGVYGVSALVVLANVLVYELLKALRAKTPLPLRVLAGIAALQLAALGYGAWRVSSVDAAAAAAPSVQIGVIQPKAGIDESGQASFSDDISVQQELSRQAEAAGAQLIVWPEVSYPDALPFLSFTQAKSLRGFTPLFDGFSTPVLFGAMTYDPTKRRGESQELHNSAFLASPDGALLGPYHKNFLVWFSEALPFSDLLPFLDSWFPTGSTFRRGKEIVLFPFGEFQIAPDVCNDDIMPAYSTRLAGKPANVLINITNDAWFGDTAEPHAHLALSTFRAVESHLYLVRATNTGISSLTDAAGRIRERTPVTLDTGEPLFRVWEVKMMPSTETLYRRLGNSFAYLGAALAVLVLLRRRAS